MTLHIFAPRKVVEDGYGNSAYDLWSAMKKYYPDVTLGSSDNPDADYILIYGPAEYAEHIDRSRPYAVYSMWETENPPRQWEEYLHDAEFVANPSPWGAKNFEEYYNLETVHYIPLGYKTDVFTPIERPQRDVFTFLAFNSGFGAYRKGFLETIEAFKLAFEPNDPVRLIIKSARPDFFEGTNRLIWRGLQDRGRYTNMEYIAESYTPEQMAELCGEADIFIFPSKGEGFGHTPLEAMGTGLSCIIPNHHGVGQYFNKHLHYTYDTRFEQSQYDREGDYGLWPVPKVSSLADTMKYVVAHKKEVLERGEMCPQWAQQWNYQRTAEMLNELITIL